MYDNIAPEDPTQAPAIISTELFNVNQFQQPIQNNYLTWTPPPAYQPHLSELLV